MKFEGKTRNTIKEGRKERYKGKIQKWDVKLKKWMREKPVELICFNFFF